MQSYILKVFGAVILPYVLCVICHAAVSARHAEQETRNGMLEQEDARLSRLVREIRGIETAKSRLLGLIRVYEEVRRDTTQVVPILNLVSTFTPAGVAIHTLEYSIFHPREQLYRRTPWKFSKQP